MDLEVGDIVEFECGIHTMTGEVLYLNRLDYENVILLKLGEGVTAYVDRGNIIEVNPTIPEVQIGVDLETDMARDNRIRRLVQDDSFANDLYAAMCNVQWRYKSRDDLWSASWRTSGGIVASLRAKGEDYMNFYCSGNEGLVSYDVDQELRRLGWEPIPYDD